MTYIYETCTVNDAIERARAMDRLATRDKHGNFTHEAIDALFEWYEEIAEATGEPIKLDVIAWCCDWSEHNSAREAYLDEYCDPEDAADFENLDEDEAEQSARDFFEDNSTVLDVDGGRILIQSF